MPFSADLLGGLGETPIMLKLKVTSKVLDQVARAPGQEQIAIASADKSLSGSIAPLNKNNRARIRIAGALVLELGDTSAFWRSHNQNSLRDFDSLFGFLKQYPDIEFAFPCHFEDPS